MIEIPNAPERIQELRDIYEAKEPDVFYKNHWDLAKDTGIPAQEWKHFLMIPVVAEYISQELNMLVENQRRAILRDLNKNQRSVGTAQILNALDKVLSGSNMKDGPIFIYTYVPLNEQEHMAPNVIELKKDPFKTD